MKAPLTIQTVVVRNPGLLTAEIDAEVVALSIERGTCYGLNQVGSRLWSLIGNPIRVGEICSHLENEFEVATELCEKQVLELLNELLVEGLILISDH
jgi:hypothetical protein